MQGQLLEIVLTLLCAAITCAASALGNWVIRLIREKIGSQKVKDAMETAVKAVQSSVAATAQTYADALKKEGKFDAEAQKTAFEKAKATALAMLSEGVKATLKEYYGDLDACISAEIEAAVRQDKATEKTAAA